MPIDRNTTTFVQDTIDPATTEVVFTVAPTGPDGAAHGDGHLRGLKGHDVIESEATLINDLAWETYRSTSDGSLRATARGVFSGPTVRLTVAGATFDLPRATVPAVHVPTLVAVLAAINTAPSSGAAVPARPTA